MKTIFDKCKLGDLTLKSRIIRTGLWESQQNDLDAIYNRYEKIASSGVGLVTSELYSIYPKDKFTEHSFRMSNPNFMIMARKVAEITHSYDVPILGQVEFIKYNRGIDLDISVNDLTIEDIRQIQSDIIEAAQKLQVAGFDGIQLSVGNNFFLSKFINHYYNQRNDDYGGNVFNRMRLVLELVKVMKDNNIGYTFWPYKKLDNSCMMGIQRPAEWDSIVVKYSETDRSTYKDFREKRPSQQKAWQLMKEFLRNCRYANCKPQTDYIQSMGLRSN